MKKQIGERIVPVALRVLMLCGGLPIDGGWVISITSH